MPNKEKVLLIDGNSVAFRAFFALHSQLDTFISHEGLHTNAIYGFNRMLDNILKKEQPTKILVAFDAGKTTFRTKEFADYKGGRSKTPSELSEQFPYIQKLLEARGIKYYQLENYEADDIIGTLSKQAEEAKIPVTVVTGDRDLTQLTTDDVTVDVTVKGVNQLEEYTPAHFEEKLGIKPKQLIDVKGLMGDTSDNYPGVTKVGEKTALKLIKQFGSIEGVYDNLDQLKPSKMKEHLIEDKDQAFLSKKLATIDQNAPIKISLSDIDYRGDQTDDLLKVYEELDFRSYLADLQPKDEKVNVEDLFKYTVLTEDNLDSLKQLDPNKPVAFEIEILEPNYHTAEMYGFVIGQPDNWFLSKDVSLLEKEPLKKIIEANKSPKYVFDGKKNYVLAHRLGLDLANVEFDLLLASYLLNPSNNSDDLGEIAHMHGYEDVKTDATIYGLGAKRAIPDDDVLYYQHLVQKAAAIYQLQTQLDKDLKAHEQWDLFKDMEIPLSLVLADMEIAGIKLDNKRLEDMGTQFKQTLDVIEEKVYAEAGEKFNLNSPKQLGEILFEKMKLPVIKRTKTGYSTSVEVLEQLRSASPIIDDILQYRQIAKIQSTYVAGLLKVQQPDEKIHTRYTQTLTQTGRLSSVDPNLQNIPIRVEEGRQIRSAFIPSHKDWQIFSSDYSQIELRVLAHISGDENMQEAFKENRDIHANTAMRIFGLSDASQVTPDMRRQAKATNFGIVYGISDYGLSQNIGISRQQAKKFINAYFEQYPKVKDYMDQSIATAREKGYVETLFHRRRYLPDINAKNYNRRSFAERTAMNTPIQGSAADIIKMAMLNMKQMLKDEKLKTTLLLQVHDELIFEVPDDELDRVKILIPKVMDSAVKLNVPLKVESHYGPTWYDAK